MRVAEMKEREDFDSVLRSTLTRGWSDQLGESVEVAGEGTLHVDQEFRYHRFLGAYYTPYLGSRGRKFLRDSIRFTPQRSRLLAQWLATEVFGNSVGLKVLGQPGFWLVPGPVRTRQWVIVPGNQRIRVFDFSTMTTRVFLKEGFDAGSMKREITLRSSGKDGPYQSITSFCPEGTFLEEPILDGWDMNRIPPWLNRSRLQQLTRKRLLRWLERTQETTEREAYVQRLQSDMVQHTADVRQRYGLGLPSMEAWISSLVHATEVLPQTLITAQTHGDFQWGNVFVSRQGQSVNLIDWEHSERRSFYFDFYTETLGARQFSRGSLLFTERLARYLRGDSLNSPVDGIGGGKRRGLLAVFLLETLRFILMEAVSGPYSAPPESLQGALEQWPEVVSKICLVEGRGR